VTALQRAALGAAAGSAALLAAAFAFQYLGGLAPCPLCLWQRWPHAVAVALGALILVWPRRELAGLAALALLVGAGIAGYHVGIEQGWWPGPSTCVAPELGAVSAEDLLQDILAAPVVRCDEIAWSLFGVSMAGWNGIASLVLAALWARAYASSSASQ
jgi:disulfide bond formation protein DsbB